MLGLSMLSYYLGVVPLIQHGIYSISYSFYVHLGFLLLAFISHLKCVFTNPGTLNSDLDSDLLISLISDSPFSKCMQCTTLRPYRTHHCHTCKFCVLSMDHHCPWVNNCIGHYTAKPFILFLTYTLISSILLLVHIILRGICITSIPKDNIDTFYCTLVGMVTVLYIVFIGFMLRDQWMNIIYNTNAIDQMQGHHFKQVMYK